ncbi:MAG: hypothetical protein LUI60_07920 [Clostridia bacterium]|nr:hypothetical protein [Clostridia bacterium]
MSFRNNYWFNSFFVIRKSAKKTGDVSFEELGRKKLKEYFDNLKVSPDRKIDTKFYSGCEEIRSLRLIPTVFVRGGKFEDIEGADFLIDEINGKFAICSTFDEVVIRPYNIFDMDKVIGVSLSNNGQTVYETKKQNGLTRAAVGYVLAGGVGAVVGVNTATQETTSQHIDDINVTITYNNLSRAYLVCNFGGDKIGADHLYQVFTVICKRNDS